MHEPSLTTPPPPPPPPPPPHHPHHSAPPQLSLKIRALFVETTTAIKRLLAHQTAPLFLLQVPITRTLTLTLTLMLTFSNPSTLPNASPNPQALYISPGAEKVTEAAEATVAKYLSLYPLDTFLVFPVDTLVSLLRHPTALSTPEHRSRLVCTYLEAKVSYCTPHATTPSTLPACATPNPNPTDPADPTNPKGS